MAVGGGGGNMGPEHAPTGEKKNDEADKPLEQRLVSKNWQVRADAYKELGKAFNASSPNCASDLFKNHVD